MEKLKACFYLSLFTCMVLTPVSGWAANLTMAANSIWANSAGENSSNIANASAGDNVDLAGYQLSVTNNGIADDGSGSNAFNIGTISSSLANGQVSITGDAGNAVNVTIASVTGSNVSDFTLQDTSGGTVNSTATVTGPLSAAAVNVSNEQSTATTTVQLNVGGNLNSSGDVLVSGGTGASADAVLSLGGSTNISAGGFSLADGVGGIGIGILEVGGTSTQTVTGLIDGTALQYGTLDLGINSAGNPTSNNIAMQSNIGSLEQIGIMNVVGTGTVTFNGTVDSDIIYMSTGSNAIFNKDVTAGELDFFGDGTVTLAGGVDVATTVGITSFFGSEGTLIFQGANTVTGSVGQVEPLKQISLTGSASSVTVSQNVYTNNLSLGNNTLNIGGNYTQNASGVLATAISSGTTYGRIIATGNAALPGTTTLDVSITGPLPTAATSFDIVEDNGTAGVNVPGTVSVTGSSRAFTALVSSGDLLLDFSAATFASSATTSNGKAAAAVLDKISGTATGDMGNIITILGTLTSAQVNSSVNSMLPVTGFEQQATTQVMDDFVGTQMAHLNAPSGSSTAPQTEGFGPTGMSAGDQPGTITAWAQAFGTTAHQSAQGTNNGYDLEDAGGAVGIEDALTDTYRMGIAAGDAYSWVQSKDDSNSADINAAQFSLYGGFKAMDDQLYLNYSLSYAYNDYSEDRNINIGPGLDRKAKADYNGNLFGGTVEGGYGINLSPVVVTPNLSVSYDYLQVPKYHETNAGALDLDVGEQHYDRLRVAPGFKVELPEEMSFGTLTPELHAKYLWDAISQKDQIIASFAGGGTAFTTTGYKPSNQGADVGAALSLATKENLSLSLQYDLEIREDYLSNTGLFNVAYKF